MKVIQLTDSYYVQPQAILVLRKNSGLTQFAPTVVRDEVKANAEDPNDRYANMMVPTIDALLIQEVTVTIHFSSEAKRDERLAELIKEWREEQCE